MFTTQFWKIILRISFAGLFFGAFAFIHITLQNRGYYNLESIQVKVVSEASESEKYYSFRSSELLKSLDPLKGISLWELELEKLASRMENEDWIEEFTLARRWPNGIEIEIIPRVVRLNFLGKVRRKPSQIFPVTDSGKVLRPVLAHLSPNVPFLENEKLARNEKLLRKAIVLMKDLPQVGLFSQQSVSEIGHNKSDGFWLKLIEPNIQVKIGEIHFAAKTARVTQVLEYVQRRQIDVRVIDANLSKKVLVRLRKDF